MALALRLHAVAARGHNDPLLPCRKRLIDKPLQVEGLSRPGVNDFRRRFRDEATPSHERSNADRQQTE
jgi:hypothetical protein